MSSKLEAGKMKRTAEMALQAFSRAVRAHLSVFIIWNVDSMTGSLFPTHSSLGEDALAYQTSLRSLFRSICRRCSYIDHYQPWTKHAYTEIALQWWQKGIRLFFCTPGFPKILFIVESSPLSWQEWADTSSQLEAVASLAAHIHITTCELLTRTYGEAGRHLASPKLFIECLTITQKLAVQIKQKELVCNAMHLGCLDICLVSKLGGCTEARGSAREAESH